MVKYFIKMIPILFVLVSLTSCLPSANTIAPDVYFKGPDKFDTNNTKVYSGSDVDIKSVTFGSSGFSFFYLRFTQSDDLESWQAWTLFSSKDWIFVNKIKFLVDKDVYEFDSLPEPIRKVGDPLGGSDISERNIFIISPKFCKAILSANAISVRLIGQNSYIDRDLSKNDIQKLTNFISYVDTKVSRTKLN